MEPLHAEADKFEPRLARAYRRAVERLRERVPIVDLAAALETKDVHLVMAVLTRLGLEDVLVQLSMIHKDAFVRGGKIAAVKVNNALLMGGRHG